MELSGELTSEHLLDHAPLPDPLPISDLIEARFLRQVRLLPADTQLILLVAAADPEGDPRAVRRAAESLGLPAASIEPAVDDGILVIHPRVEFSHPSFAQPSTAAPRPWTVDVPTMPLLPSWIPSGTRIGGRCTLRSQPSVRTSN
jgi:hypothetical protein